MPIQEGLVRIQVIPAARNNGVVYNNLQKNRLIIGLCIGLCMGSLISSILFIVVPLLKFSQGLAASPSPSEPPAPLPPSPSRLWIFLDVNEFVNNVFHNSFNIGYEQDGQIRFSTEEISSIAYTRHLNQMHMGFTSGRALGCVLPQGCSSTNISCEFRLRSDLNGYPVSFLSVRHSPPPPPVAPVSPAVPLSENLQDGLNVTAASILARGDAMIMCYIHSHGGLPVSKWARLNTWVERGGSHYFYPRQSCNLGYPGSHYSCHVNENSINLSTFNGFRLDSKGLYYQHDTICGDKRDYLRFPLPHTSEHLREGGFDIISEEEDGVIGVQHFDDVLAIDGSRLNITFERDLLSAGLFDRHDVDVINGPGEFRQETTLGAYVNLTKWYNSTKMAQRMEEVCGLNMTS